MIPFEPQCLGASLSSWFLREFDHGNVLLGLGSASRSELAAAEEMRQLVDAEEALRRSEICLEHSWKQLETCHSLHHSYSFFESK